MGNAKSEQFGLFSASQLLLWPPWPKASLLLTARSKRPEVWWSLLVINRCEHGCCTYCTHSHTVGPVLVWAFIPHLCN